MQRFSRYLSLVDDIKACKLIVCRDLGNNLEWGVGRSSDFFADVKGVGEGRPVPRVVEGVES